MSVEHALALERRENFALQFGPIRQRDKTGAAIVPGRSTVETAHRAVDLKRCIHLIRLVRIDRDSHDAIDERAHLEMVGRVHTHHQRPALAAIVAAVDADRRRARKHDARILRMKGDRPHLQVARRKLHALPMVAAVGAAIRPVLRAGKDDATVLGMDGDAVHVHDLGKPFIRCSQR